MEPIKIVLLCNYDDWGGLYYCGQLVDEGHDYASPSRMMLDVLNILGIDFNAFETDFKKYGFRAPEQLPNELIW